MTYIVLKCLYFLYIQRKRLFKLHQVLQLRTAIDNGDNSDHKENDILELTTPADERKISSVNSAADGMNSDTVEIIYDTNDRVIVPITSKTPKKQLQTPNNTHKHLYNPQ